jgi:hypothetical protein
MGIVLDEILNPDELFDFAVVRFSMRRGPDSGTLTRRASTRCRDGSVGGLEVCSVLIDVAETERCLTWTPNIRSKRRSASVPVKLESPDQVLALLQSVGAIE